MLFFTHYFLWRTRYLITFATNPRTSIDECHATGFFGKTGRGTPEYCGQSMLGFTRSLTSGILLCTRERKHVHRSKRGERGEKHTQRLLTGVEGRVDIINSTLGKALGGATGGYTTASKPVVDLLRQRGRPCVYPLTTSILICLSP